MIQVTTTAPVCFTVALLGCALAGHADAELLVDQQTSTFSPSGGVGAPAIQSFTPAVNSIAGVDVYIGGTAALENDLSVGVYESFSNNAVSGLVVEGSAENVPRGNLARVVFDSSAPLVPEQVYYLQFELSTSGDEAGGFTSLLTIGTNSAAGLYDRGELLVGGGNLNNASDALFQTLYLPEPGSLAVLALGGVLVTARRRRGG